MKLQETKRQAGSARLIYVCCDGLLRPVIESQVLGVLEQFDRGGRCFDLLAYGNLQTGFLSHRKNVRQMRRIQQQIHGEVKFYYLPSFDELSVFYGGLRAQKWLSKDLASARPILFHCRNAYATHLIAPLRRRYPWVRIIFDVRGEHLSEYDYRVQDKQELPIRFLKAMKRLKFARWQREGAWVADLLLCVSEPLSQYFRERFPEQAAKVMTLRTGSDEQRFCFSEEMRSKTRHDLGLEERTVWIYSGSLKPYQMIDETLCAFQAYHKLAPSAFLIILTPDQQQAKAKLDRATISSQDALVRGVEPHQVPPYLMAADWGIVFREKKPINLYASPTKLGEYWLCGLPVITTPGCADGAAHIKAYPEAGLVIDIDDPASWGDTFERIRSRAPSGEDRQRIRRAGQKAYSREHFLSTHEALCRQLLATAGS